MEVLTVMRPYETSPDTARRSSTYMKNAKVEKTPQVWKAWFICSCDGYMTAASIMIHQPVKN